jgi:hypothetical protein
LLSIAMKHRLNHETGEETVEESTLAGKQRAEEALSFDTPEAMLRHDAAHTPVPPRVRERVMQSISREAAGSRPKPWWKRWMPF